MSFWGKQDEEGIAIFLGQSTQFLGPKYPVPRAKVPSSSGQSAQFLGPKCPERGEPRRDVEGQASQVYGLKVCLLLAADFNLGIVESGALCSEQAKNKKPAPERAKSRHRAVTWDSRRRNEIISSLRNRTHACNRLAHSVAENPQLIPETAGFRPVYSETYNTTRGRRCSGMEKGANQWPENSLTRRETAST